MGVRAPPGPDASQAFCRAPARLARAVRAPSSGGCQRPLDVHFVDLLGLQEALRTEVELVEQTQGACRFNRTWGYDLTNRELWVNGGCGGRFKLVKAEAEDSSRNSNAAAAAVAVAAIAGIAILAKANRDRPDTSPPPEPPAPYGQPIRSQRGMCLDVADGRMRPGAAVQLYACHGRENQRFSWGRGGEIVTPSAGCARPSSSTRSAARRRPGSRLLWAGRSRHTRRLDASTITRAVHLAQRVDTGLPARRRLALGPWTSLASRRCAQACRGLP